MAAMVAETGAVAAMAEPAHSTVTSTGRPSAALVLTSTSHITTAFSNPIRVREVTATPSTCTFSFLGDGSPPLLA